MAEYEGYQKDREAIRKKLMEITNDAHVIEDILSTIDKSIDKAWHDGYYNG